MQNILVPSYINSFLSSTCSLSKCHFRSLKRCQEKSVDKWATASLVKQSYAGLMGAADVTGKQLEVVSKIVVRGGRECSYSKVQSAIFNLTLENGR